MNLESSLRDGVKKFNSLSKETHRRPKANNVHDLRVVTRKLRADLWLIPKAQRTDAIRKARRDLKQLGQVLGEQRQCDVALEDAIHYKRKTKHIKRQRDTARKKVLAVLRKKKRESYTGNLKQAIRDIHDISPRSFSPRIDNLRHQLVRAMKSPPRTSLARHQLRIRVKRARYVLEAFHHEIPRLTSLQDRLGRWHDLVVLSAMSGYPKKVIDARNREWRLAERSLGATLGHTSKALRAVVRELNSRQHRATVT